MDASRTLKNRRGIAAVYLALILIGMLGIAALVVDLGHLYVVKSELQNSADAAALSGAMEIYSTATGRRNINFPVAESTAKVDISLNKSDGGALSFDNNGEVTVGFWNMSSSEFFPSNNPNDPTYINKNRIIPTVKVKVNRSDTNSVPTFFARILSSTFDKVAVKSNDAIAGRGFPGSFSPGNLLPFALTSCVADNYFNQNPLPSPPTTISSDTPYPTSGGGSCNTGQWTTFFLDTNNTADVRKLISSGNTTPVEIGDSIWIQPGVTNTLFNEIPLGTYYVPIVSSPTGVIETHAEMQVVGFVSFTVDKAVGGGAKKASIEGHFNSPYVTEPGEASPGGSKYYGILTPPILVK